jgi:hypothetical protein
MASAFVVKDVKLNKDELSADSIKAGTPEVFSAILSESEDGKIIRGIWKCTVCSYLNRPIVLYTYMHN